MRTRVKSSTIVIIATTDAKDSRSIKHLCIHMLGALVRIQEQYSASRQSPTIGQIDERLCG
jgi:hypothetical protein